MTSVINSTFRMRAATMLLGGAMIATSFASFAPAARAASASELQAQIAALMAQLSALQGGQSASYVFTRDLTVGSSGADVTALQKLLISKNFRIAAGATGYFGEQTRAALAAYQASAGISPASGYFGPVTRAKLDVIVTVPPQNPPKDDDLTGGAGSIDSYELMASLNNEKVGEDEEDVEVAGLEIEADDTSDLRLTALRLVFAQGTADSDFEDFASEVSVYLDGDEIARVDADEFTDRNDYTKTISLDRSAIIESGDTAELTVAVSGEDNIDSADQGDTWSVDFRQIRFVDADGASISEDPSTAARMFSFESFASATNAGLRIAADDDAVNDTRAIAIDDHDDTDNEPVLSFTLEAEGDSDLDIRTMGVHVAVTGATNTDDVISDLSLWIDGKRVANAESVTGGGSSHDYVFEDVDYTLDAGDTVDAEIRADFLSTDDALDEGDTISFRIDETETNNGDLFDIEDESGEELKDADMRGNVDSGAFELRTAGIIVSFVSADEDLLKGDNADDDIGTFTVKYKVEAFGSDVYVSDSAAATTTADVTAQTVSGDGILYLITDSSVPTTAGVATDVSFTKGSGVTDAGVVNGVRIREGKSTTFTLTVVRTNDGDVDDDGFYRVSLVGLGWATTDTSTWNVYDFNLENFKTGGLVMN